LPTAVEVQCEAFAFAKLIQHLQVRTDVQNIDQMILAGFCRNCMAKWYAAGAKAQGIPFSYDAACEVVYGMSYKAWKERFQKATTPERLAAYEANKHLFAKHEDDGVDAGGPSKPAPITGRAVPLPPVKPGNGGHSDVCSSNAAFSTPEPDLVPVHLSVAVLTVSDRASAGVYQDESGPQIRESLEAYRALHPGHWDLHMHGAAVVPDDVQSIAAKLEEWSNSSDCNLILTTGGTGFAPRDVTPEATLSLDRFRNAPGFTAYLQAECSKIEPMAAISRAVAGARNGTLIVNLPGRPKAVKENMHVLMPMLRHVAMELRGGSSAL